MSKQITYVGALGGVDVPAWGLTNVRLGVPVTVSDACAADLLRQVGTWSYYADVSVISDVTLMDGGTP